MGQLGLRKHEIIQNNVLMRQTPQNENENDSENDNEIESKNDNNESKNETNNESKMNDNNNNDTNPGITIRLGKKIEKEANESKEEIGDEE